MNRDNGAHLNPTSKYFHVTFHNFSNFAHPQFPHLSTEALIIMSTLSIRECLMKYCMQSSQHSAWHSISTQWMLVLTTYWKYLIPPMPQVSSLKCCWGQAGTRRANSQVVWRFCVCVTWDSCVSDFKEELISELEVTWRSPKDQKWLLIRFHFTVEEVPTGGWPLGNSGSNRNIWIYLMIFVSSCKSTFKLCVIHK